MRRRGRRRVEQLKGAAVRVYRERVQVAVADVLGPIKHESHIVARTEVTDENMVDVRR